MSENIDEETFLEKHVGDLTSRRRLAERLIEGRRIEPGETLYYGYMTVRLLKSGDPTVVGTYDADERPYREIDTAGEDPERIEELQYELDRAYLHRNEEL